MDFITVHVDPDSILFIDDAAIHDRIPRDGGDRPPRTHSAKGYVLGNVHDQTIGRLRSLVKRGIGGANHATAPTHLQGYDTGHARRSNYQAGGPVSARHPRPPSSAHDLIR
ncbi:MAG: transposase [Candidatus Dormibacteria bacterium]